MSQDKKTLKIKALIFSVLRAKTQNLQTFSIFSELELTFESLGTSLINLFGKRIFGAEQEGNIGKNSKFAFVKNSSHAHDKNIARGTTCIISEPCPICIQCEAWNKDDIYCLGLPYCPFSHKITFSHNYIFSHKITFFSLDNFSP